MPKTFSEKAKKNLPKVSKWILSISFSSTCCNWHIDGSFEDLARNVSKEDRLIIAQCSKINEKIKFCKRNYLPSNFFYEHLECSFDNTAQFFLTKSWNLFRSMSTEDIFFSEIVSFKLIPRKPRMHFWQPWWKDSTESRNIPLNVPKL